MAAARFFAAGPIEDDLLPLAPEDLHHAVTVLRLAVGDELTLVGDDRMARTFRLTAVSQTEVRGDRIAERSGPTLPDVTLVTALGKGDKTDLVVEKAVELGVAGIVLLDTARSVVRLDANRRERRVERLRRIAGSAARQADRFEIPQVAGPLSVAGFAATCPTYESVLVAWEEHSGEGIDGALAGCDPQARVAVVVGPEGGLTADEVAALTSAGAVPVTLGPTILRTETAGIVATALVCAALGGLGFTRDA